MESLAYLIPVAVCLGAIGLAAFLWAMSNGQFEDLEGAASRILFDDPQPDASKPTSENSRSVP